MAKLTVGEAAPDFTLPCSTGSDFCLSRDAAGQALVLYFYPKDFTPVCSAEACGFRDHFAEFQGLGIPVYGISSDDIATHQRFIRHFALPFHLLSDTGDQVAEQYAGRIPIFGLLRRSTFLLDSQHRIAAIHDERFGAQGHIRSMLKALQG